MLLYSQFGLIVIVHILSKSLLCAYSQTTQGLVLPEERTTGLGCIQVGRNVSYQCTVTDTSNPPIASTVWSGSAFQCPSTSNRISLSHSQFISMSTSTCGSLMAMALEVNGTNYVSQLILTATTELNGTTISCFLSGVTEIGSDELIIGGSPAAPGRLIVSLSSGTSLTVSWSPPAVPVEGGVGGYVLGVTGEGCGCVSMNVSADTTSVTCSGWTAAGQTCSFEVRTRSQDCGFVSSPAYGEKLLIACDPAQLGESPTSFNGSGTIVVSNGIVQYNGVAVGSTAVLICNKGYTSKLDSGNRTCNSDGNWSGSPQICDLAQAQQNLGLIALVIPLGIITLLVAGLIGGCSYLICRKQGTVCARKGDQQFLQVSLERRKAIDANEIIEGPIQACEDPPRNLQPAPKRMIRPCDAVVLDSFAYFRKYRKRIIYVYNLRTRTWAEPLPNCPPEDTTLAALPVHNGTDILHTVGGFIKNENKIVGDLYVLGNRVSDDCSSNVPCWKKSKIFHPMTESRKQVTAIRNNEYLIVAGGRGKSGPSRMVEVLNTSSKCWSIVASLPQPIVRACGCISGGYLYFAGGCRYDVDCNIIEEKSVYKALLTDLIAEPNSLQDERPVFERKADLRHVRSTCVTFQEQVFAIGGTKPSSATDEALSTNHMYRYDCDNDLWKKVPTLLSECRCLCFAVSVTQPSPQLMVVGGYTVKHDEGCTDSVEFVELNDE